MGFVKLNDIKLYSRVSFITLFLGLGYLLAGCSIVYHCLEPSRKNISHQQRVEHLVGHWMELKRDVFLYQYRDTGTYALDVPGNSSLPFSIKEYLKDPENWQNTDTNSKIGQGAANGYYKHKVVAVIPAGTKLYIEKVLEKQTLYDSLMYVIAHIYDYRYCSLEVNIYFLLELEQGRIIIPYPEEPELSTMGREIIPQENPGIIEFCDAPNSKG